MNLRVPAGIIQGCIFFYHFLIDINIINYALCCGWSLEPSGQDGSKEVHNGCFHGKIRKIVNKLSLLLFLIWSSASSFVFFYQGYILCQFCLHTEL